MTSNSENRNVTVNNTDQQESSEFVNRTKELTLLSRLQGDLGTPAALLFLRSPSGFGKSRLTSEFLRIAGNGRMAVAADPLIRGRAGEKTVYEGYFIQRAAQAFSFIAQQSDIDAPNFRSFASQKRWANIKGKNPLNDLRTLPSLGTAYKAAVEYVERFFSIGQRDPSVILETDDAEAVSMATAYVDTMFGAVDTTLIVRECQHIDYQSLRALLSLHRRRPGNLLVLEYTTENGEFQPDHQKLIMQGFEGHSNAFITDLLRLDRDHFEELLRRLPTSSGQVSGDFHANWNGNLRVLEELKFQVSIGRQISGPTDLGNRLVDLRQQIVLHIAQLSDLERFILATIIVHEEPISKHVLDTVVQVHDPSVTRGDIVTALDNLEKEHRYIEKGVINLAIQHEDIVDGFNNSPGGRGLAVLCQNLLRDVFVSWIDSSEFKAVSFATAARLAFRLSAATGDLALLASLINTIDKQLREANDQAIYVDIVADIATDQNNLLPTERSHLLGWAAQLAYEICDFSLAARLFREKNSLSFADNALLAHCLIEEGKHDEVNSMIEKWRGQSNQYDRLADLVRGGYALDTGRWDEAKEIFKSLVQTAPHAGDVFKGHAERLWCEMEPYPRNTELCLDSVNTFKTLGLKKSAAYSALSASRFLARSGDPEKGMNLIDDAVADLKGEVRSDVLILNNSALVGLLQNKPDFDHCAQLLRQANRLSRHDFSDLVIQSNLAIAEWKRGDLDAASSAVMKSIPILDNPTFTERDIFWPVCFNLAQVFGAMDDPEKAQEMRERPYKTEWTEQSDKAYWQYRYKGFGEPEPLSSFMLRFDYHPSAFSHWHIDASCVAQLTG